MGSIGGPWACREVLVQWLVGGPRIAGLMEGPRIVGWSSYSGASRRALYCGVGSKLL